MTLLRPDSQSSAAQLICRLYIELKAWSSPFKGFPSCHRFIYETEHFNGVAELLEILGR